MALSLQIHRNSSQTETAEKKIQLQYILLTTLVLLIFHDENASIIFLDYPI